MYRSLMVVMLFAVSACGRGQSEFEETSAAEQEVVTPVTSISPDAQFVSVGSIGTTYHLQNSGAVNTCAYRNGIYLNTQTCNTTDAQKFQIYQQLPLTNNEYNLCAPGLELVATNISSCNIVNYDTGKSKFAPCVTHSYRASCVVAGDGEDVRIGSTTLGVDFIIKKVPGTTSSIFTQYIKDGKTLYFRGSADTSDLVLENGVNLKNVYGKNLARKSTEIVVSVTPDSSANQKWVAY